MNTKTNNNCPRCDRNLNLKRKTYFIGLTKEGLVVTSQCRDGLTVIGQSGSESEARQIAALVAKNM